MRKCASIAVFLSCISSAAWAADMPYALPFNSSNEFSQIGIEWAEAVSNATGGEVNFEPVLNSALVTIPETLDAVTNGVVPAAMGVASAMAGVVPAFGYLEISMSVPLENPSSEDAMAEIFPQIDALLEPQGVKALWIMPGFGGGLACKNGFVKTADEWSGLKIRIAGRWQAKQIEVLGASPVSLPASDVYTALQNGTIDCALLGSTIYLAASLHEVAPYFTDYRLTGNALVTIIGMDVWDGLTEEQQKKVEGVSAETTVNGTRKLREIIEEAAASIDEKADYYAVSDEELAKVVERWDPLYREAISTVTDEAGKKLVNTLYSFK